MASKVYCVYAEGGMGHPWPYLMPKDAPYYDLDQMLSWQELEGKRIVKVAYDNGHVTLEVEDG